MAKLQWQSKFIFSQGARNYWRAIRESIRLVPMSRGVFALLACFAPAVALAQPVAQPAPARAPQTAETLLADLQHAGNPARARQLENQIDDLWSKSGSPSADLLLERAEEAADKGDFETAYAILVRLTAAAPNFAEAWH